MEGTGWVRGLNILLKAFHLRLFVRMLWYGGSIEQRRSLAHEPGMGRSWRGRSTLCSIRRYKDYPYRSLLPPTRLPDHTHVRNRPFLLTLHGWLLQTLNGRIGINLSSPRGQVVVRKLLAWRTAEVRINQMLKEEPFPGE